MNVCVSECLTLKCNSFEDDGSYADNDDNDDNTTMINELLDKHMK